MIKKISCSLVTYNNDFEEIKKVALSFLNSESIDPILIIVDNSQSDLLKSIEKLDSRIIYIFNNNNLGFGKAHNIAISKAFELKTDYHLILNPDVFFDNMVLNKLIACLENDKNIGLIMPSISYFNGDTQQLCKLLPNPLNLILRKAIPNTSLKKSVNKNYELNELLEKNNNIVNIPSLSGCFMLCPTHVLEELGGFDERYFMYMEDVDLCRRIHYKYKTSFYPYVKIYHGYRKESYSNKKLTRIHAQSAVKYFNKWGWFFDIQRKKINKKTLLELESKL